MIELGRDPREYFFYILGDSLLSQGVTVDERRDQEVVRCPPRLFWEVTLKYEK